MSSARILTEIRKKWLPRKKSAHKGDFGKVLIAAGSKGMHGAAHLAAAAALRSGTGLVTLVVPEAIYSVTARRELEIMVYGAASTRRGALSPAAFRLIKALLQKQTVFALGPGLSRDAGTVRLIQRLVKEVRCSVVLDADGLNAFEGRVNFLKVLAGRAVITPHAGEFCRLFGHKPAESQDGRIQEARKAARQTGICVVLKGSQTVVAEPSGKFFVNTTGNPGMATAGTGDVLTGMIAGLLAQGLSPFDAARFSVYLHGLAGDLAARQKGEVSMIASDLLNAIPQVFKKSLGKR